MPLLALGLGAALILLIAQPGDWLQRFFAVPSSLWWIAALFMLATWLAAESQAFLQTTGRIHWQALIAPLTTMCSVVALLLLLAADVHSLAVAAAVVSAMAIVAWGAPWLYLVGGSRAGLSAFDASDLRRQFRYGAPMVPNLALGYVSDWGDHILLSRLASLAQVGTFAVAYQLLIAVLAANGVLTAVLLPRAIGGEARAPGFLRRFVEIEVPTILALWMIVAIWVVAVLPAAFRLLAGRQFEDASVVLLVLMIAVPSSVATTLYKILFNVQERMGRVVFYSFVMTLTNVGASVVLIPMVGAVGAAIATALSYAVVQACYVGDQHRRLHVRSIHAWTLWASGLALGITQVFVGTAVGPRLLWAGAATVLVIVVVRTGRCVNHLLIEQLFVGRLNGVAILLSRVLVPKAT
jgi:O-antigen/teichoic acid export membrane protein